jgi:choline monooxygenase
MSSIAERIAEAHTLPGSYYGDADVFRRQKDAVFARSWQWVATTREIHEPGRVYPFTLLPHCLDEPLLLTRAADDTIHCLSNVCTHRGNIVVEHPGVMRDLRCRYHGRRFKLDGTFAHMPEFEGVVGFPAPEDCLPKVPFAVWKNIVFCAVHPVVSFDEWFAPVRERMDWLDVENYRFQPALSREYLVHAPWALYCDNYLEGFHIPYVHPDLNQSLDYGQYHTDIYEWCNVQVGISKSGEYVFDLPPGHPDYGKSVAGYYWWLFPNLMLNFYPWGLSVNVVRPIDAGRTKVEFLTFVGREEYLGKGAGAALDRVEREDEAVVENVAKGVASRFYKKGRYSPRRETGVHHFHRLLDRFCPA